MFGRYRLSALGKQTGVWFKWTKQQSAGYWTAGGNSIENEVENEVVAYELQWVFKLNNLL